MTAWTADSGITADSAIVTADGGTIAAFAPHYLIQAPAASRQRLQAGPLPYAEVFMRVGENESFGIDWAPWLANRWIPGALVALGFTIRPSTPNGYQFPCTFAGASADVEPLWPAVPGAIVIEGGVIWTCQPIDTSSLAETVASVTWTVPTGVSVNASCLVGQIAAAILDVTAATAGIDYVVVCNSTMSDGEVRIGQFKLKVR